MSSSTNVKRKSRAKANPIWDLIQSDPNKIFSESLKRLAERFPTLTKLQLCVAFFIQIGLYSWQIAQKLYVTEHEVEKIRSRIRKKLGIPKNVDLLTYLIAI